MKKAGVVAVTLFVSVCALCFAQAQQTSSKTLNLWHIYGRQFSNLPSAGPMKVPQPQNPIAVLTPPSNIVVRRIEAISQQGPNQTGLGHGLQQVEPKPCPMQFNIVISNGLVTQSVPISNVFLAKGSVQTYTDSGPLNMLFSSGNPSQLQFFLPIRGSRRLPVS